MQEKSKIWRPSLILASEIVSPHYCNEDPGLIIKETRQDDESREKNSFGYHGHGNAKYYLTIL